MLEAKHVVEFSYHLGIPDGEKRYKKLVPFIEMNENNNLNENKIKVILDAIFKEHFRTGENSFKLVSFQLFGNEFYYEIEEHNNNTLIRGTFYPVLSIGQQCFKLGEEVYFN